MSHTTFELSNLRLAQGEVRADGVLVATFDVTNTRDRAGDEVVQFYVGARSSAVERALKELKAFSKLERESGETRTARLAVPVSEPAYYDADTSWGVEPGDYKVGVGRHSLDEQALRAVFAIRQVLAYQLGFGGAQTI